MINEFDKILDECIDRIGKGESLEQCLATHPDHAKQLEPLLQVVIQTKEAYAFTPSMDAKREARQRFFSALDKREKSSFLDWILGRRWVLATVASVLIVVIVGLLALNATVFTNDHDPTVVTASPNPDGNFVFLVSDDVNAIADFSNVNVTVSKIRLLKEYDSDRWIEFAPETNQFDLTLLPGETTQELWHGDVPEGQYTKVVIYVTEIQGILKTTGQVTAIKLPGNKLQISKSFQVSADNIVSFTYDLTVVQTGSAQKNGKYVLKPQVNESSANEQPAPDKDKRGTKEQSLLDKDKNTTNDQQSQDIDKNDLNNQPPQNKDNDDPNNQQSQDKSKNDTNKQRPQDKNGTNSDLSVPNNSPNQENSDIISGNIL